MEPNNYEKQPFTEEESGFDIIEWVNYFLHFWYLFVIGIVLSLGLASLENRTWLARYQTAGKVMIEESRTPSANAMGLMQGFGVESGYRNAKNQVIMFASYDLISKVVDSLPFIKVDYISKGNFKTRNLYNNSPIYIKTNYIAPEAYNLLFKIKLYANGTYTITVDDNKDYEKFSVNGRFEQPLQDNLFFMTVHYLNKNYTNSEFYFQFRSKESLVSDFTSRVKFGYEVEGSSVLIVSLESETPDRDIDFINKLCDCFLSENLERKNEAANKTIKFIDSQLKEVSKSLSASEDEMTRFRQESHIVDVQSHTADLLGKASKYDLQEAELNLREEYLKYLSKYLKTNMEAGTVIAPTSMGVNDQALITMVEKINELYTKRSDVSEKNIFYAKYTKEINTAKAAVLEMMKSMRISMDIEKNDFKRRYGKVNDEIKELPKKELEMIAIERKYKMDDNYFTFFLQKRAESDILKASNSPDNIILDRARIVGVTNADKKSKTTMLFMILGLLIPAVIVIVVELLNNTVRSTRDVEKNSSFPLIGSVRHTTSTDPALVPKNPRSTFTEMFRVIRTRIEFIVQRKMNIMVMATSTESGDGKSYFCINLAAVYAMVSPKTILVDMDIRKPSINQRFEITQTNGVSNYLINQCTLDEIIIQGYPGAEFDILPAGTIPPNPGELIRSEKLIEMFAELRKRYDFIIVDSSPIGIVTDAYSLAALVDATIFVVRSGKTNKGLYKRLSTQLKFDNIKNMYTVMNDVGGNDGSNYSKYNSYGYKYSYGFEYTSKKKKQQANEQYAKYYEDDSEL